MRSLAILLCTRYGGAFRHHGWVDKAAALVEEGLAVDGDEPASFAAGALRVGRSWGARQWSTHGFKGRLHRSLEEAKRDAERAVEMAEEIGSSLLLAYALEGFMWLSFDEGHRDAAALGERQLQAAAVLTDRVEAHESLVVAVMCFARAGQYDRARAAATEASQQALRLGRHRRLHAAGAEALARAPSGAFGELLTATSGVVELARDEGTTCSSAILGLAGRTLALSEAGDPGAEGAATLLQELAPPGHPLIGWGHTVAELLRPVIGLEATCERLDAITPDRSPGAPSRGCGPRSGAGPDRRAGALRGLLDEAHELAGPACAPDLAAIAEWGEAAAAGDRDRAARATAMLDAHGEHYTAARLLEDCLMDLGVHLPLTNPQPRLRAVVETARDCGFAAVDGERPLRLQRAVAGRADGAGERDRAIRAR